MKYLILVLLIACTSKPEVKENPIVEASKRTTELYNQSSAMYDKAQTFIRVDKPRFDSLENLGNVYRAKADSAKANLDSLISVSKIDTPE